MSNQYPTLTPKQIALRAGGTYTLDSLFTYGPAGDPYVYVVGFIDSENFGYTVSGGGYSDFFHYYSFTMQGSDPAFASSFANPQPFSSGTVHIDDDWTGAISLSFSFNGGYYNNGVAWWAGTIANGGGTFEVDPYKLHFTFSQTMNSSGAIQQGLLSAELFQNGNLLYTQPGKPASCDDAFPLLSGADVPLDTPPTLNSSTLGLVFSINALRAGFLQSGVELHGGSVSTGNGVPLLGGQFSYDSQSCLVVSKRDFLTPLANELYSLALAQNPSIQPSGLSSWINQNVTVSIDSNVALSQPKLNLSGTSGNAFVVQITRPIEKAIKILYSVSDGTAETIREVILPAHASKAIISIGSLLTDLSSVNSIDPYLSFSDPIKQANYVAHYNEALGAQPTPGASYVATILGYQVNYQGKTGNPKYWYFDSKQNDASTQIDLENLMFGNVKSATIQYKAPQSVAQALSNPNPSELSLAVNDSSANIVTSLDQLSSVQSGISSIAFADAITPTIKLSAAEFQVNQAAINKFISPFDLQINLGGSVKSISAPTNAAVNGNGGQDTIVGDNVHNVVVFSIDSSNYDISSSGVSAVKLTEHGPTPLVGTNYTVSGVEFLQFTDRTIFIENADNANIARLYSAALGRPPDIAGLSGWEDIYANNISSVAKAGGVYQALAQTNNGFGTSIAGGFVQSVEFQVKYGSLNDGGFVSQLYQNVLGRTPATAEVNAWLDLMHNGDFTRDMVLVGFAESPENIAKTAADWLIQI